MLGQELLWARGQFAWAWRLDRGVGGLTLLDLYCELMCGNSTLNRKLRTMKTRRLELNVIMRKYLWKHMFNHLTPPNTGKQTTHGHTFVSIIIQRTEWAVPLLGVLEILLDLVDVGLQQLPLRMIFGEINDDVAGHGKRLTLGLARENLTTLGVRHPHASCYCTWETLLRAYSLTKWENRDPWWGKIIRVRNNQRNNG